MSPRRVLCAALLGTLIIPFIAACSANSEEESALATLAAIYAEQTQQAANMLAEEEAPTACTLLPTHPPKPERTLEDVNSSSRASEHRGIGGDNFLESLYERPFTAGEMDYQPYLDILTVDFAYGEDFFYFTIRLEGQVPDQPTPAGLYGIEFDQSLKGRGDLLVLVSDPGPDWSTDNLTIYQDKNGDVGGPKPLEADKEFNGSGYDAIVPMTEEACAFARLDPQDNSSVQIAISRKLLESEEEFLWGAWADDGLKNAALFDYNDTMDLKDAGSPMKDDEHYPINELYSLDNTCRLPYGFAQAGSYPGMCKIGVYVQPKPGEPGEELTCPPGCWILNGVCQCIE